MAATEIHGGSADNRDPAIAGMLSAIIKYGDMADITKYLFKQKKAKKCIISEIKAEAKKFEKSQENLIRYK